MKAQRRMAILNRDGFACLYCGDRPGNAALRLVRVIPASMGGLEVEANLATACAECARGKGETVMVPKAWCDGHIDLLGWVTWKRWGEWHLQFAPGEQGCALTFQPGKLDYWIDIRRAHEGDWEEHIGRKRWARSDVDDEDSAEGPIKIVDFLEWMGKEEPEDEKPVPNDAFAQCCDGLAFCRSIVGPKAVAA